MSPSHTKGEKNIEWGTIVLRVHTLDSVNLEGKIYPSLTVIFVIDLSKFETEIHIL